MRYVLFTLFAISLTACNQKNEAALHNNSPNGKAKITVLAKRPTSMDPWQVEMKVKAYSFKEGSLKFEAMADNIDETNVKFKWADDYNCTITYTLRDKEERRFQLIASPEQMQMGEINADGSLK